MQEMVKTKLGTIAVMNSFIITIYLVSQIANFTH